MISTPSNVRAASMRSADGMHDVRILALENGNVAFVVTRISDGAIRAAAEMSPVDLVTWLESTKSVVAHAFGQQQAEGEP